MLIFWGVQRVRCAIFFGFSALARGASHGIWNSTFPLPWGARGAILAAALHALTAGA